MASQREQHQRLSEFLYEVLATRSLRGLRRVRPTKRDLIIAIIVVAVSVYSISILINFAIDSHCLTDKNGPNCDGGWFP